MFFLRRKCALENHSWMCHTWHTMSNGKKLLVALLFVLAVIAIRYSPLSGLLTFDNLVQHRDELAAHVRNHAASSAALFVLLYIVVVAFSIPGAALLTLAGGFLFTTRPATIYANIGATA